MISATRRFEWDMAHRIPNHRGKCSRLHGHRYVLELSIEGPVNGRPFDSDQGMVIDFDDLDRIIKDLIGEWDHRCMLWSEDPIYVVSDPAVAGACAGEEVIGVFRMPFIPTAENIAGHVRDLITHALELHGATDVRVRVWETPKGSAEAY